MSKIDINIDGLKKNAETTAGCNDIESKSDL